MVGIYCIENLVNGKMYFGQSVEIEKRLNGHRNGLRGGYHENSILQRAWNKYGENCFEFSVVELCEEGLLDDLEVFYISTYGTTKDLFGYNFESGGLGRRKRRPRKISDETRRRLSESHTGKTQSAETIAKRVAKMVGRVVSKETGTKISQSKMGKPQPYNLGNKYSLGVKPSEETKRKRIETRRKNGWVSNPEKTKENMSKAQKKAWEKRPEDERERFRNAALNNAQNMTEETKKKMSESRKAMFARRRLAQEQLGSGLSDSTVE